MTIDNESILQNYFPDLDDSEETEPTEETEETEEVVEEEATEETPEESKVVDSEETEVEPAEADDPTEDEAEPTEDTPEAEFIEVVEDKPIKLPDGRTLTYKELEGEMMLKQKYNQRVNELNDEKKQFEAQAELVDEAKQLRTFWEDSPKELVYQLASQLGLQVTDTQGNPVEPPQPGQDYASKQKVRSLEEQAQQYQQQLQIMQETQKLQSSLQDAKTQYGEAFTPDVEAKVLELYGKSELPIDQIIGYFINETPQTTQTQPTATPAQPSKPKRTEPTIPMQGEDEGEYDAILKKYGLV